jgi:hypothetical protein
LHGEEQQHQPGHGYVVDQRSAMTDTTGVTRWQYNAHG